MANKRGRKGENGGKWAILVSIRVRRRLQTCTSGGRVYGVPDVIRVEPEC
jgi:hypothetical protein